MLAVAGAAQPPVLGRAIALTELGITFIMRGYWLCIILVFVAYLLSAAIPLNVFHTKRRYLCGGGGGGAMEQYGKIPLSL
jgi:hypothetical protein